MDEEKTKNKRIPIAEVRATMNQIGDLYDEITGVKFARASVTSQELLDQRSENLKAGNSAMALLTTIHLSAFNGSGAADLKEGFEFDGDGFLKMKKRTLRELLVEALQKVGVAKD